MRFFRDFRRWIQSRKGELASLIVQPLPKTMPELMRVIEDGRAPLIDITEYLKRFSKNGGVDVNRYMLASDRTRYGGANGYGEIFGHFYHDSRYSMVLVYRILVKEGGKTREVQEPLALIGFELEEERSAVFINQIQGKRDEQKLLAPLRWEKMLVSIVVDLARFYGLKKVGIQTAANNGYYPKPEGGRTLTDQDKKRIEGFRMRYDVTARRCGFRLNPESGKHELSLSKAGA